MLAVFVAPRVRAAVVAVLLLLCLVPAQGRAQDEEPPGETPPAEPSGSCDKTVDLPLVRATTEGCLNKTSDSQWESTDEVKLNGIPVKAAPDTKLVLNGPSDEAPGGKIALTASISVAGFSLNQATISQPLPAGGNGEEKDFVTLEPSSEQSLFGLKLAGKVSLRFGKTADGTPYSSLVVVVALPELLKRGPDNQAGGLTNTVAVRVDESGVKTDAVKIEVENAYLGSLQINNLCLSYVAAGSSTSACKPPDNSAVPTECAGGSDEARWDGAAELTIPTASRPKLGLYAGVRGGAFSYAGAQVSNLGTSVPIATGVFLDKFGLGLCVDPPPFRLKGTTGIKFGSGGKFYLDGSIEYVNSEPWVIEARGSLSLYDQNVANAKLRYQSTGDIDFAFDARMNFGGGAFTLEGDVAGWYQAKDSKFDVFGRAKVCVAKIVCVGGEVAISHIGVAGCVRVGKVPKSIKVKFPKVWKSKITTTEVSNGASYRWAGGGVKNMLLSCGTGDVRAQKAISSAGDDPAKRTKIRLRETPGALLILKGDGAPPKVEIRGPKGVRIKADDAGELKEDRYFFAQDDAANTMNVTIANPEAGDWTVRALPGSAPLTRVSQAPVYPDASADGQVKKADDDDERDTEKSQDGDGDGDKDDDDRKYTLSYAYLQQPDQEIEFVEFGKETQEVIGRAGGEECDRVDEIPEDGFPGEPKITCGEIDFEPGPGPKGDRKIIGVVYSQGVPTDKFTVDEFKAPKEEKLDAPEDVNIERVGTKASIFWMRVADARGYRVNVDLSNGESMVYIVPAGTEKIDLPDAIPTGVDMNVQVSAIEPDGSPGRVAKEASEGVPGGDEEPEPPGEEPDTTPEEG